MGLAIEIFELANLPYWQEKQMCFVPRFADSQTTLYALMYGSPQRGSSSITFLSFSGVGSTFLQPRE
jgi:hypothetical protein